MGDGVGSFDQKLSRNEKRGYAAHDFHGGEKRLEPEADLECEMKVPSGRRLRPEQQIQGTVR